MGILKPPTKEIKGRGRKPIDYDKLYDMWVGSKMMPEEFLALYGMSDTSSTVREVCRQWREKGNDLGNLVKLERPMKPKEVLTLQEATHAIIDKLNAWRRNQGEEDYVTANALRQHIKAKLKAGMKKNQAGEIVSSLSEKEISSYAKSLNEIQRIQRLALGMSTDNVGIADNRDTHVEKQEPTDDTPTFIVEVNENGKFKRPRPRRLANK